MKAKERPILLLSFIDSKSPKERAELGHAPLTVEEKIRLANWWEKEKGGAVVTLGLWVKEEYFKILLDNSPGVIDIMKAVDNFLEMKK